MTTLMLNTFVFHPTFELTDTLQNIKRRTKPRPNKLKPIKSNDDGDEQEALLQKARVLDQTGNPEMALVYFHRGSKFYPKCQEFTDGIKRAEKHSQRKGTRRMKITPTGDISIFTKLHKPPPPKTFRWKNKPKEPDGRSVVPSASFKSRLIHPLVKIERTPSIHLNESRASTNSFLAGSLHSLAYEDMLIKDTSERDVLGNMYSDKEYLQFLVGFETYKNKRTPLGKGSVGEVAEHGLLFLEERSRFWNSLGPLPPPHPSRTARMSRNRRDRSRMSHYTSMESLNSVDTIKTDSSTSKSTSRKKYKSRYSYGVKREKPNPPPPERVNFDFSSYKRDPDLREMTQIQEEEPVALTTTMSVEELNKEQEDMKKRGEEISDFVTKELGELEKLYDQGRVSSCKQRADSCVDMLGRYTDDEVASKGKLLATLYNLMGNCDVALQKYDSALDNFGHDLLIGEESENLTIQSRALGNIGRVHVIMGKYNRALDVYNRKAPLCQTAEETAWLFHEIGNCFLHLSIYQYAYESGLKALRAATDTDNKRLQLQTNVLTAVSEVNLTKYKDAYQHFEVALDLAKVLDDQKVQESMTRALVDVNKKMVNQMKSKKKQTDMAKKSPVRYNVSSRAASLSARTDVTVEG